MKLRASGKVVDYYEASAKNGYNIDKTIQVATMFAIEEQKKVKNARKKRCSIL